MIERMNVKRLREWLASLPPEFDDAAICSDLFGSPSICKRVIAWRDKDGSGKGIVSNPLGSHLRDSFFDSAEIVSCFDYHWEPKNSEVQM